MNVCIIKMELYRNYLNILECKYTVIGFYYLFSAVVII